MGYENDEKTNMIIKMVNNRDKFNFPILAINIIDVIYYKDINTFIKYINDESCEGKMISVLKCGDLNSVFNYFKENNINNIIIESVEDVTHNVFKSNTNSTNHYIIQKYMIDYSKTKFAKLYYDKYGYEDIMSLMYIGYYMVLHWVNIINKNGFTSSSTVIYEYGKEIVTPEIILYYNKNGYFYNNYYSLISTNNGTEYYKKYTMHGGIQYHSYSPIAENGDICVNDSEVSTLFLVVFNYYIDNSYDYSSIIDAVISELSYYKQVLFYN